MTRIIKVAAWSTQPHRQHAIFRQLLAVPSSSGTPWTFKEHSKVSVGSSVADLICTECIPFPGQRHILDKFTQEQEARPPDLGLPKL